MRGSSRVRGARIGRALNHRTACDVASLKNDPAKRGRSLRGEIPDAAGVLARRPAQGRAASSVVC